MGTAETVAVLFQMCVKDNSEVEAIFEPPEQARRYNYIRLFRIAVEVWRQFP